MENTNKQTNKTVENNTTKNVEFSFTESLTNLEWSHDMVVDHIATLSHALKNRMWGTDGKTLNDEVIKNTMLEFAEFKRNFEDDAVKRSLTKLFWAAFNNHEQAVIKNANRTASNVVRATKDRYAAETNTLLLPVGEQMAKMKNLLSTQLKKGQFPLFYSRREYLEAYKTMTVEEYSTLYRGSLVKVGDLIAYLGRKITTERKNNK